MTVNIEFRGLRLDSVSTWVPVMGEFCGPGWSAGTREPVQTQELYRAPEAVSHIENGQKIASALDKICKRHDISFSEAKGKINEAELKFMADIVMIDDIKANFDLMEDSEKNYAKAAVVLFSTKLVAVDVPSILQEKMKNSVVEFLEKVNQDPSLPPVIVTGTREDGSALTCEEDPQGNFIVECRRDGEVQRVVLDDRLQVRTLSQQYLDAQGGVEEETAISMNSAKGIAEIQISAGEKTLVSGVLAGNMNQKKLDKFSELAESVLSAPVTADENAVSTDGDMPGLPNSNLPDRSVASPTNDVVGLLRSMNVTVDSSATPLVNQWFADADPIFHAPYRWTKADANLNNLWRTSSAGSNASYDLFDALQQQGLSLNAMNLAHDSGSTLAGGGGSTSGLYDLYSPGVRLSAASTPGVANLSTSAGFDTASASPSSTIHSPTAAHRDIFQSYIDPVVLQFGSRQIHTTSREASGVMFDMEANGRKVHTGWITPDEAFLVMDRNGNGLIDDSTELFSERSSLSAKSGLAALGELDSNRNGKIDTRDKQFSQLRLWTDMNADGISQAAELRKLVDMGVYILFYKNPTPVNLYDNGNMILSSTEYVAALPYSGIRFSAMAEVLLNYGEGARVPQIYLSDQSTAVRLSDGRSMLNLQDSAVQTVDAFASGVNILVGGKGDVLNAGSARQSLLIGNGGTQMNGNSGDTQFIVNGTGNTVTTGTGHSVIEVNGDLNTIRAIKGDNHIEVTGNKNSITIGDHDWAMLGGDSNKLSTSGKGNENDIFITGTRGIVNASNSDIVLADHADVTLNGRNNDIVQLGHSLLKGTASGGSLMVWGEENQATISNAFIGVMEGAELELKGTNDRAVLAGDASLTVIGTAGKMKVSVFGGDNQLTMSGGSVVLDEHAELALNGTRNTLTMLGDGELSVAGSGNRIDVFDDGNLITANKTAITEHAGADASVLGASNSIRSVSGSGAQRAADLRAEDLAQGQLDTIWNQLLHLKESHLTDDGMQLFGLPPAFAGADSLNTSMLAIPPVSAVGIADPSLSLSGV